jgi:hypothetical protein
MVVVQLYFISRSGALRRQEVEGEVEDGVLRITSKPLEAVDGDIVIWRVPSLDMKGTLEITVGPRPEAG